MKAKLLLFATVDGITPEGDFDASDEIDQYYYFTNDPSVVAKRLEDAPKGFKSKSENIISN